MKKYTIDLNTIFYVFAENHEDALEKLNNDLNALKNVECDTDKGTATIYVSVSETFENKGV